MTTVIAPAEPVIVAPGQSRTAPLISSGAELYPKLLGEDTGGTLWAGHGVIPPLAGPPPHIHTPQDEWL